MTDDHAHTRRATSAWWRIAIGAIALGMLPVAAAGTGRPAAALRGDAGRRDPRRLHDAARGVRGDHPAVPGHRGRPGRHVRGVVRTVRRPEPRGRGGPARRPRRVRALAGRRAARRARHRVAGLGRERAQAASSTTASSRSPSARATPRASRLGRPHPRGRRRHHAEPVHVGRCAVEPPGGLPGADRGRQDARKRRSEFLQAAHRQRRGHGPRRA